MVYVVKFTNLAENTRDEFAYEHLYEALSVAKNTQLSDRLHYPALNDDQFDSQLLQLLTTGIVYGGMSTENYPDGEWLISLYRRDGNGTETVVYNALPMPAFEINSENEVKVKLPLPKRPVRKLSEKDLI